MDQGGIQCECSHTANIILYRSKKNQGEEMENVQPKKRLVIQPGCAQHQQHTVTSYTLGVNENSMISCNNSLSSHSL